MHTTDKYHPCIPVTHASPIFATRSERWYARVDDIGQIIAGLPCYGIAPSPPSIEFNRKSRRDDAAAPR
ncbi:hypothetical protein A0U93_07680 [Neoasaia chiangmaiensis]|uniref:Uncharacterized protein n=1 Tax=Neoasaia chiangmaiensis TaxID=320497 RepID=A0A1U9KPU7_9PROT|nr:hypothetical protein A0U93_07680 [Neoasaia chiangmaiensis]